MFPAVQGTKKKIIASITARLMALRIGHWQETIYLGFMCSTTTKLQTIGIVEPQAFMKQPLTHFSITSMR